MYVKSFLNIPKCLAYLEIMVSSLLYWVSRSLPVFSSQTAGQCLRVLAPASSLGFVKDIAVWVWVIYSPLPFKSLQPPPSSCPPHKWEFSIPQNSPAPLWLFPQKTGWTNAHGLIRAGWALLSCVISIIWVHGVMAYLRVYWFEVKINGSFIEFGPCFFVCLFFVFF